MGIGMGTGLGIGMPQQGEMMMPALMGPRTPAASGGAGGGGGGVQMTFDEGLLRTLCDLDVSPPAPPPRSSFVCARGIVLFSYLIVGADVATRLFGVVMTVRVTPDYGKDQAINH